MSLVIWLPLNGDIKNKGLSNIRFESNSNYILYNQLGKLGICAIFGGSTYYVAHNASIPTTSWSVTAWIYPTSSSASGHQYVVGLNTSTSSDFLFNLCHNANKFSVRIAGTTYSVFDTLTLNKWYHVAATYDGTLKIYINGELSTVITSPVTPVAATDIYIGTRGGIAGNFYGNLNDIRIYDETLSPAEVKAISQGLIAHYKLDDPYIDENLIRNGFGEFGAENWTESNKVSTTEIPTDHPEIKASFFNGNMTKEYTPIISSHSYTISGYVKSSGATSGTTYPSIYPYDADKKFINNYNTADGFGTAYQTTLAQPLKKGDTVIYATDLSAWTTANNNYYFRVAIFGYKDSFGTVYPNMIYTQDCPAFGTYSDKSHIDKTNNTITLNAAFTGEDRPAGTAICQTTEGSTYWYPWGGIALSSISDWVFKTKTFTPKNTNRLKSCKYIRWNTYSNCYIAGNLLVDNNYSGIRIVDSSGFGNHGTVYKYDSTGFCKATQDTAKNLLSTKISSANVSNNATGMIYVYGNCTLKTPEQLTVAFWCKPTAGYNNLANGMISLTNNEIGITAGQDYNTAPMNHRDGTIDINSVATVTTIRPTITFTANEWHHYVITYDGRYGKVYKDGVLSDTKDMGSNKTLNDMKGIVIGFSRAGGVYRKVQAYYSDFRLYVTALSATDIESLYKVSARITKNNKFQISEINEDLGILKPYVYKSGIIESKGSPNPNLLIHTNTKTYGLGYAVAYSGGSITLDNTELFNGKPTIKVNPSSSNTGTGAINQYNGEVNLTSGKTYCYSCWIKSNVEDIWQYSSLGHFQTYANITPHNKTSDFDILNSVPANTWVYVAHRFTTTADCNFRSFHIYFANTSQTIWIADVKLEEGNVPTAWVPNENDEDYNYASFVEIENDTCKIQKTGYINADEFIEM